MEEEEQHKKIQEQHKKIQDIIDLISKSMNEGWNELSEEEKKRIIIKAKKTKKPKNE